MAEIKNYGDLVCFNALNTNMSARINVRLYLADGLLIDCGPEVMQAEIVPFLLEYKPKALVLTHLHEDHSGMAAWIEQNMGIPIYINAADIDLAAADGVYAEYRHMTWGDRRAFHALPLGDTISTGKYTFKVLNTPGHVPLHSVLFEESQGWLFTGDLYIRSRPKFAAPEEDMCALISSLETILKLPFDTVFCGHAGIMENGREKLKIKLENLLELQSRVNSMRQNGMTDEEINLSLYPDQPPIFTISDGEWTTLNIIKTI